MKNHLAAPSIHTSALKIVPMSHHGFCKMLWYCSILLILNQFGQLWIKEKIEIFYWFKCIHHSFKLSFLTSLSELWLCHSYTLVSHIKHIEACIYSFRILIYTETVFSSCTFLTYFIKKMQSRITAGYVRNWSYWMTYWPAKGFPSMKRLHPDKLVPQCKIRHIY